MIRTGVLCFLIAGVGGCKKSHEGHAPEAAAQKQKTIYQCPMHPEIVRDKPGQCPICHMDLQPIESKEMEAISSGSNDRAAVRLSAERQQLIGVTFGKAEMMELVKVIRASGRVAFDPNLYSAIEEHRQAVQTAQSFPKAASAEALTLAKSIARSTRMKLRLLGLSEGQIDEIDSHPADSSRGLVIGRPGGKVWVYADVYENEVHLLKPGQTMEISSPSNPGEVQTSKIVAVDPVINPVTRTARVRTEISNVGEQFRPEMYLHVKIKAPLGKKLAIPREAVLDTGERRMVFVVEEDGAFTPVDVILGPEVEGYYEVRSGLGAGNKIVTSANFLIDSESRARAAAEAFRGHRH
jgi:Cu(I)/Ag(I) efflux system membrane fusion protein